MSKFQNRTKLPFHCPKEYTDEQKAVFLKIQVFFHVTGTVNCYRRFGTAKCPSRLFRRIGGFLESKMSVTIYLSTETTTPLDFQGKREVERRGGRVDGVTNGTDRKGGVGSRQNSA
jgi:hypothetical protein